MSHRRLEAARIEQHQAEIEGLRGLAVLSGLTAYRMLDAPRGGPISGDVLFAGESQLAIEGSKRLMQAVLPKLLLPPVTTL